MSLVSETDLKPLYGAGWPAPFDFFLAAFTHSVSADLGIAYFCSGVFASLADGLVAFLRNSGQIRLVINDQLLPLDAVAIEDGMWRSEFLPLSDNVELLANIIRNAPLLDGVAYDALVNLIASGRLSLRIARPAGERLAIVHHKFGIFTDAAGNSVGFNGSANLTNSGLIRNSELLNTFTSWNSGELGAQMVQELTNLFEDIWYSRLSGIEILSGSVLSETLGQCRSRLSPDQLESMLSLRRREAREESEPPRVSNSSEESSGENAQRTSRIPRKYQKKAVEHFLDAEGRAIFAMATGTGKTFTAILCLQALGRRTGRAIIPIVLVPSSPLVQQWADDLNQLKLGPVLCIHSRNNTWRQRLSTLAIAHKIRDAWFAVVCTYDSYVSAFHSHLEEIGQESVLLIADEVHTFGRQTMRRKAPEKVKYRLGLSATPTRQFDEYGSEFIRSFFLGPGQKEFNYNIGEGIRDHVLVPYEYNPIFVHLDEQEFAEYAEYSERLRRIGWKLDGTDGIPLDVQRILVARHRVLESTSAKLPAFRSLARTLVSSPAVSHVLAYVPEGEAPEELRRGRGRRWIDVYTRVLSIENDIPANQFVQGDPETILDDFASGKIRVLTSIARLDEGIDIARAATAVFVSSSTSQREFIQRRGRVLRPAPGKLKATIHDFVVLPPISTDKTLRNDAESIARTETRRVIEFAESSLVFAQVRKATSVEVDKCGIQPLF